MVAVICKQQVRHEPLSACPFLLPHTSTVWQGNGKPTEDLRQQAGASVPGGVLKITRKRGAQVTFVTKEWEMLGSFLTPGPTHTYFST